MKYIISFFIILLSLSFTEDRSVVITGTCLLEGENNHSGVEVLFEPVSNSATTTSVFTDIDGSFTAALSEGIYRLYYQKNNFITHTSNEITFFSDVTLEDVVLQFGSVVEILGNIDENTIWTDNNQYRVTGDLTLNQGDTLIINPGVEIFFIGDFQFNIYGILYAMGTQQDSIKFSSFNKQPGDWKWIEFGSNQSPGSHLQYSLIEYGGSQAMDGSENANIKLTQDANLTIQNSTISNSNYSGIYSHRAEMIRLIDNNFFKNGHSESWDGAIKLTGESYRQDSIIVQFNNFSNNFSSGAINMSGVKGIISDNLIAQGRTGIYDSYPISNVNIYNNEIFDNIFEGMSLEYFNGTIENNILYNNRSGIYLRLSESQIGFNKIYNHSNYGLEVTSSSSVDLYNNTIFSSIYLSSNCELNAINNIISGAINSIGQSDFYYNCFYNSSISNNAPEYFGEIITVNANGDSSDTWYNIFTNPILANINIGNFTPLEDSPVIDAGNPDSLDLDGSISDIGAIYFDYGTIPPTINSISADNTIGVLPLPVQFTTDFSGPVTNYEWTFGDGAISNSSNPVHLYTTAGNYEVSLTVEGPGGTDTFNIDNMITVNEPQTPPLAIFSTDITEGLIPLEVQFTNLSQNEINSYFWNFGDGNTSTEQNPEHIYEESGIFSVSLIVTGPYGNDELFFENYITAYAPEAVVASFEMSQQVCIAPCEINFTNTSIGTIDSYSWDFGDGGSSINQNPTYTFNETGTFTINLEASGYLNTDLISQDILVLSDTPSITSITDIPNDQGGRVLINFTGSGYDGYDRTEFYTAEINIDGSWVTANFSPPYESDEYGFIVHTLTDSSASTDGMTDFRVLASMDEGVFISDIVSGYSVDNIHPTTPSDLLGTHLDNDLTLQWNYNMDMDFNYHEIKSLLDATRYSTENQVTFTQEESYDEYTVNSVDINDNISENSDKISVHNLHYGANLVGLNVLPDNLNISIILESLELNINSIIGEGEAASLNPTLGWIGSLTNISPGGGYWIRVDSDDMLILPGESVDCEELNFNLNEGANLISYCCKQSMPLDIIPGDCSEIVGEGAASTFNPVLGWIGNLQELNPGKGYWLKCSDQIQMQWDCEE